MSVSRATYSDFPLNIVSRETLLNPAHVKSWPQEMLASRLMPPRFWAAQGPPEFSPAF
jgi:hypothetical protein